MAEKAAPAAVMAADDLGDAMQCADHPFRSNPGGICAFCLQDKLGKLVSSSSSSSPSSSFPPLPPTSSTSPSTSSATHPHPPPPPNPTILSLKRSKSVAPRPPGVLPAVAAAAAADSPRKKSFWSFLTADRKKPSDAHPRTKKCGDHDGGTPSGDSSFGRKVARSRSVGCGSRSFSGDFLDRISTGFGDCTLRRVESQREPSVRADQRVKERVRCGGIFGGFGMIPSSYWLSAAATAADDDRHDFGSAGSRNVRRNRNWGWAFASRMRAFKPIRPANAVAVSIGNGNTTTSLAASTVVKT